MSFSLKLLGGVALASAAGPLTGPAVQRHRLALLALLATARSGSVSRDKLMAWLWPERDSEPARRLLNQAVHAIRQALGPEALVSTGDELQLNRSVLFCDVAAFEEALGGGEPGRAVGFYGGPFLDGFYLDEAPELERWVERERDRLGRAYAKALEELAEAAEREGDAAVAVERWKARAAHDPYDSGTALRLMLALERVGNRAGALQHAAAHQQLLRQELEIEPSAEVQTMVARLRRDGAQRVGPSIPAGERAAPPPREDALAATPPVSREASPRQWRLLRYAAALAVLAVAIGGGFRLAARSTGAAAAPAAVDEIARAVARELERRERGDTAVRRPQHRTRSIPAYELYLRGDDPTLLRSDSGARKALEYFRQAVALDSTYAAAWVGLARLTYRASERTPAARAAAQTRSEAAVRKALALDDSLAEAHALLGVYRGMAFDWAEAERHFRRALGLEPTRSRTREWYVQLLLMTGRRAEALAEAERAVALDPLSPSAIAELARTLGANGRCEEALARLETIKALDPPLLRVPAISASCYGRLGRWQEAITILRPLDASDSGEARLALLGYVLGRAGRREEALAIQARLLDRWRKGEFGAMSLASVPAALGDRDEAFGWIDRALQDGSLRFAPGLWMDLTDVPFDALAEDPRMAGLRRRFGYQNP